MLLIIIVLVLLFGGVGPYWGYNNYGNIGGALPLILLVVVLLLIFRGGIHF
jgi:hypothetical protein